MKTIIVLFAVLLSACSVDDPEPTPTPYPAGNAYCDAHLDGPTPITGLGVGPCQLTITVDVHCPPNWTQDPAFNTILVWWETAKPAYYFEPVLTTYECNSTVEITFLQTACEGLPFTAAAGFQDPVTGEYKSDGSNRCATTKAGL